jgi:hypothetical protein
MKSLPDEVFMAAELLQEEETENGKIQKGMNKLNIPQFLSRHFKAWKRKRS